jgi:uncharacterized damage-inducible protein DinB
MKKHVFDAQWDHLRQMVGIANRLIEMLPEDKLDSHPIPNMRTPKELVVHAYGMGLRRMTEGIIAGEFEDLDEQPVVNGIRTRAELMRYCLETWDAANRAAAVVTDEMLHAEVKTPWNMSMPGSHVFGATYDEFLHHRGQLYAFARALGAEIPIVWDFEHNAPEFRPRAAAEV